MKDKILGNALDLYQEMVSEEDKLSPLSICYRTGHRYDSVGGGSGNNPRVTNYDVFICIRCGEIRVRASRENVTTEVKFHFWTKRHAEAAAIMADLENAEEEE